MITKADWRQTVQTVLTLIQNVDTFNAARTSACEHFRLNPLEMLLVLDVMHTMPVVCDDPVSDPTLQLTLDVIEEMKQRYSEYALWLGKLPGRDINTVKNRIERVTSDFQMHRDRLITEGKL